jgi:ferredoxin
MTQRYKLSEAVVVHRLIIPPEEAEKLVSRASKVYLRDCPCRSQMQVCPSEKWEVCLLFEHASEKDRQLARLISTDEALQIVRMTTERGDIHQVFYFQDGGRPYELCNCCTCCCSPFREAKKRSDHYEGQLHSAYIAVTDAELCTGCGKCGESCFFEARQLENGVLLVTDELCFGCGRCIPNCPEEAIRLEYQTERGVPIPGPQL